MASMPPPPAPGQQFPGVPPNSFMNMGPPRGQVPPQRFNSGLPGPPPMGDSVNGFVPPTSQGPMPPGPTGMNRPPGPAVSAGGAPPQPAGNFRPPVSGQFVPPSSYSNSAPPAGVGPTVNGTSNTPPLQGLQQPLAQPPSRFQTPPMSQGGSMPGPPRLPAPSANPPSSMPGPPRMGMSAPPPSRGTGSAPPTSANSASGASTPNSGLLSKLCEWLWCLHELPVISVNILFLPPLALQFTFCLLSGLSGEQTLKEKWGKTRLWLESKQLKCAKSEFY